MCTKHVIVCNSKIHSIITVQKHWAISNCPKVMWPLLQFSRSARTSCATFDWSTRPFARPYARKNFWLMKMSFWLQELWCIDDNDNSPQIYHIENHSYWLLSSTWILLNFHLKMLGTNSATLWQVFLYSIRWQRDERNTRHQSSSYFGAPWWIMQGSVHSKVFGNEVTRRRCTKRQADPVLNRHLVCIDTDEWILTGGVGWHTGQVGATTTCSQNKHVGEFLYFKLPNCQYKWSRDL